MKRIICFLSALIILISCVCPAFAEDTAFSTAFYNGVEFPNIDTVWTDIETYPYAVIYQGSSSGNYFLYLGNCFIHDYVYPDTKDYAFCFDGCYACYKLVDNVWSYSNSSDGYIAFSISSFSGGYPIWSNFDIYTDSSRSEIWFAASDPVISNSGASRYIDITLNDGSTLNVPSALEGSNYLVLDPAGAGRTNPLYIAEFSSISNVYEGATATYTWYSGTYDSDSDSYTWDYEEVTGELTFIEDSYNIWYQTFGYSKLVKLSPSREYEGLLPSVDSLIDSGIENYYDNWFVYRKPYEFDFDDNGLPVTSTKYYYFLCFVSDDYSININSTARAGSSTYYYPSSISLDASVIYKYRLECDGFEDTIYCTDDTLAELAGQAEWVYFGSGTSEPFVTYSAYGSDAMFRSGESYFDAIVSNNIVASTFSYSADSQGPYAYYDSDSDAYITYYTYPYTLSSDTFTGYFPSADGADNPDTLTWLQGIWKWLVHLCDIVTNGFNSIYEWFYEWYLTIGAWLMNIWQELDTGFDNIGNWFSDLMTNDDENTDKIIDKLVGIQDSIEDENNTVVGSDADGNDVSLLDFIGDLFSGATGLLSKLFGSISDALNSFLDNFDIFDDDEAYEIFEDDDGSTSLLDDGSDTSGTSGWSGISEVFEFISEMWECIPKPIRSTVNFIFVAVAFFAVYKLIL